MNINRNAFIYATSGLALLSANSLADPIITLEHPKTVQLMGGQVKKNIDCSTLFRFASKPKELWATCEFSKQVDSNNQKICSITDYMPKSEIEQKNALSIALYQSLIHFGRVHNDCIAQAGAVDAKLGKDPEKIYGPQWQTKTSCSLIQARDLCKTAMGLE